MHSDFFDFRPLAREVRFWLHGSFVYGILDIVRYYFYINIKPEAKAAGNILYN